MRVHDGQTSVKRVTFSVVIPLFNKRESVQRAILSVLNQERLPEEIIIVDDGSIDQSAEVAQVLLDASNAGVPSILIRQENLGVSAARNRGAEEASSRFVAFLDADDEWLSGYLLELERLALAFPDATVLTVRNNRPNSSGRLVAEPLGLPDHFFGIVKDFIGVYSRGYGIIHSSSVAIRRDVFQQHGGFKVGARKSQDIQLWLQLGLSETFAHSAKPLSVWHDDYNGLGLRKGIVPFHLKFFLSDSEALDKTNSPSLKEFLRKNLFVHIVGHYLRRDDEVVGELLRLAPALGSDLLGRCRFITKVPRPLLSVVVEIRRRILRWK